ncbi:hypothetical protein [Microbispora sp. ATCC PTA-5024]|uniref:hypothetical protein n=1 Tax=Microbispora sp. ATCC PTA-5024 TaxID=316330 RepID=UPI000427A3E8|nr:hypothetical protein [Microbispora sp. ATCC PTA-5024]
MRTRRGGATLATGALVLTGVCVAPSAPAQAQAAAVAAARASHKCDRSDDSRKFALPGKSDIAVFINHCIFKEKSGGSYTINSSMVISWNEVSRHFGSMHRFNHFYAYLYINRRKHNRFGGDENYRRTRCDFTDNLNARRSGSVGCQTPKVKYSSKYDYYSDVYVVADVASDGKGDINWPLDSSYSIH